LNELPPQKQKNPKITYKNLTALDCGSFFEKQIIKNDNPKETKRNKVKTTENLRIYRSYPCARERERYC